MLFLASGVVFAQTGKIAGKITDKESKELLIGATVSIDGTTLGAVSDVNGSFIILSVAPGAYTVKASYVGYQTITVANVRVSSGLTTELNFALPSQAVQVPTVEIIAERPLINKDYTNTLKVKTAEEINVLPIRGTADVIGLQASVVKNEGSNLLYIRGGRPEEVSYLIDGVSVNNPLSGNASASFTNINQNSIEELQIQTGGFNAEYGNAMSGVINLNTKSAGSKYTASFEVVSDHLQKTAFGNDKTFGQSIFNFSLGGPIVPDNNVATFYLTGERQYLTDNDPRAVDGFKALSTTKSWNWGGKLTLRPTDQIDLKFGGNLFTRDGQNWDNFRRFRDPEHQAKFDNSTLSGFARLTHNLDQKTFYEAQFGYFNEQLKGGDGVWFDNLLSYGDSTKNPTFAGPAINPGNVYSTIAAPGAVLDRFTKSQSQSYDIKLDLNRQEGNHLLKGGFEYRWYNIRRFTVNPMGLVLSTGDSQGWLGYQANNTEFYGYSFNGNSDYDGADDYFNGSATDRKEAPKSPKYISGYVQDKVELSDLVLNLGFRLDYFDANELVVKDPLNPFGARGTAGGGVFDQNDLRASNPTTTISPRLGFSFPVTDRAVFHAQYGTFLQMPPLQNVLVSKTWEERMMSGQGGFSVRIPNPDLKPERTISYELGFRQLLTDNFAFSITGFYKEIKDLIQARNVGTSTSPAYPAGYESYENVDFGTVKGFDIIFELRRTKNMAVTVNYTLGFANGTGSDPQSQSRISWIQTENPKLIAPLDFDRRHVGSVNLDYRFGAGDGPKIGGGTPFEKTGINLLFTFNSGVPYTRTSIYNPFFGGVTEVPPQGGLNQAYTPWTSRLDVRLDRGFTVGPLNMTASLIVLNALHAENVFGNGYAGGNAGTIYRGTGEANNSGWLSTQAGQEWAALNGQEAVAVFKARENDPANYGIPRQVRLGLRVEY